MPASTRSRRSHTDADSTPNKKRKLEPEEPQAVPAAAPELPARGEFWFDEGNVVVAAVPADAAHGRSFKVHSGVLGLHSEVFRRLLDGPALAQLAEKSEGCPVLRTDDDGRDLGDMLDIIYRGGKSDWLDCQRPPINYTDFRAVVRIAVKYEVEEIVKEAKYRLSRIFCTDNIQNWCPDLQPEGDKTPIIHDETDCIDLIHLVRALDIPSILPLVLYACCNIDQLEKVAKGVEYEEELVRLNDDDMETYLIGRRALVDAATTVMRTIVEFSINSSRPSPACKVSSQCRLAFETLTLAAVDAGWFQDPSAIGSLEVWLNEQQVLPNSKPCASCDASLRKTINERRQEAWCELGTIFDVPEWPAGQAAAQEDAGAAQAAPPAQAQPPSAPQPAQNPPAPVK
ncbi:hypothetical protein PsYK624_046430 [Phanerochaete sordida]|uniref:BTB domain-containing protein n=1 Tax=Phanerochaete sordida TaxID=48140 RepID=A0A9P3G6R0_9APHY|nr:hypothetical protein PsYK624_046430 [Phanerochaete sordida]